MSGTSKIMKVAVNPRTTPPSFRLKGVFPKPFPLNVEVIGATPADLNDPNGNSGVWISGNYYSSLAVTLRVYEQDGSTKTLTYDTSGNITQPQCFAEFSDQGLTDAAINPANAPNSVIISWGIAPPVNTAFDHFRVEKSTNYNPGTGTGAFNVLAGADNISRTLFTFEDMAPSTDLNGVPVGWYRVVAVCTGDVIAATSMPGQVHAL